MWEKKIATKNWLFHSTEFLQGDVYICKQNGMVDNIHIHVINEVQDEEEKLWMFCLLRKLEQIS